jgi:uncharacterized coiled-coil protein SlyX
MGACALLNTGSAVGLYNCFFAPPGAGDGNTGLGSNAGATNLTGNSNTFLGFQADATSGALTNAAAIGANARVGESNALVLGCAPANCPSGSTPPNVGIGTPTPGASLEIDTSGAPQAYLVQTTSTDYSRLRFDVSGAKNFWDIAAGGGTAPVLNFYRLDVGNVLQLTPGGAKYMVMGNGAYLTTGGAWTNSSDRNLKARFRPVSGPDVLRRLNTLPITTWSYKTEGSGVRHIGPMAQDFHAAFGLGDDDKHITTIDEGGVALAAIQEVYRQILEKSAQIEEQKGQIAEQREEIARLRAQVEKLQQVQDRLVAIETRLAQIEGAK